MATEAPKRGLIIDGVIGSEHIDSSGEILDVEGADISSLARDGVLNYEHKGDENGGSFESIIGRCIKAKKIFKASDCENARERMYWDKTEVPFIYGVFRLFDESDHANAKAAAAIIRDQHAAGEDQILRFSIEGSTIEKNGQVLKRTIGRNVALTRKPCNKTAITGVLLDPKLKEPEKAEGLDAILGDASKGENELNRKLTSVPFVYTPYDIEPEQRVLDAVAGLKKALEGGMPGGAVGTATQGAALQREDVKKKLISVCKAALRDYDSVVHGEFRKYLKSQLPEASEEFIDHFADMVEDWTVKQKDAYLRKDEGTTGTAGKVALRVGGKKKEEGYPEVVRRIKAAHRAGDPNAPALPPIESPEFKVSKRKVPRGESYFDENNGVLYMGGLGGDNPTPQPMRLHIPNDQQYLDLLKDPYINQVHDRAMDNWYALHKLARAGQLPDEVIAHSALFSAMSPNTAVPLQELSFARLQDLMAKGWDPTKALDPETAERYREEFKSLSKQHALPQYMHDHFAAKDSGVWTKGGEYVKPVGLEEGKWDAAEDYHKFHATLKDALRAHGADARAISDYINRKKADWIRQSNTAKRTGGTAGDNPAPGFAPKTIRYLLGMAGMGNVLVPDTHWIRHSFGMMENDPRNADVKAAILKSHQEPILQAIDRYYFKNHPAVQYTREKMKQRYGEDLGEHALFPGFWLHWLSVAPHERARGWNSLAENEGTDHQVFFNAAKRVLDKYGIPYDRQLLKAEEKPKAQVWENGGSMAARTAHAVKELEDQFGTTPAQFAYYAYMVPALLASSNEPLAKAETLTRFLRDLVKDEPKQEKQPKTTMFRGRPVVPGEVEFITGPRRGWRNPLLHVGKDWHIMVGDDGTHMRLNPNGQNKSYRILNVPKSQGGDMVVNAQRHGLPNMVSTKEAAELLNGVDLGSVMDRATDKRGFTKSRGGFAHWVQAPSGRVGYVKSADAMKLIGGRVAEELNGFSSAQREVAFSHLANKVFGLGQHVPVTAAFVHPLTGEHHSIQEQVKDGEHFQNKSARHATGLHRMLLHGDLDKLALMDQMMAQSDRHPGNYMLAPDGVKLIDNGLAFAGQARSVRIPAIPHYWSKANRIAHGEDEDQDGLPVWFHQPLHPEAKRWLEGLDPYKLSQEAEKLGLPQEHRDELIRRMMLTKIVGTRPDATRGMAYFAPWLGGRQPFDANRHGEVDVFKDPTTGSVGSGNSEEHGTSSRELLESLRQMLRLPNKG